MIIFFAGILFGIGLSLGKMTDPSRVVAFLDVTGRWDATLLFVMIGALAVTVPLFPLVLRLGQPFIADRFYFPSNTRVDWRVIAGAIIFGVGWGVAGFCPGPALTSLSTGSPAVIMFVVMMVVGQWLAGVLDRFFSYRSTRSGRSSR